MVDPKMPLYRYVSFDRFVQMLFSKEIAVVLPEKWDDGYELYWLRMLERQEIRDGLWEYLQYIGVKPEQSGRSIYQLSNFTYHRTYCLCFSEEKDCEVLWRANSDSNKGIMFATSAERILSPFHQDDMATVKQVCYDLDGKDLTSDFMQLFSVYDDGAACVDADELLLHKRKCFSYEKECRLLVRPEQINSDQIRKYPIADLGEFITGVMVHPSASKEHVALVKLVCEQFGLPFEGQSELYKVKPISIEDI